MKTDQQLKKDVEDELRWDPKLNEAAIIVEVKNGIVLLNGIVINYTQKLAAEDATKRVKDVRGIVEAITVKLPVENRRTDSEIMLTAINTLRWNNIVPEMYIQVEVEKGWLTLSGEAAWQFQKEAAHNSVKDIIGLKGVTNKIKILPGNAQPIIPERIRQALERNADIETDNIFIEISGDRIILRGKAHSWYEKIEIQRAAWSAPGVSEVEDYLVIL